MVTLEDVVKEGLDERLLRNLRNKYSGPDGHKLNPIRMYFDAIKADKSDPLIAVTYESSNEWPSTDKAIWVDQTYAREAGELIGAVQAIRDESIRAVDKPEPLYNLILTQKPIASGEIGEKHSVAYSALELQEKLRDPEKAQEVLKKYVEDNLAALESKSNKNVVSAVKFALARNPRIATVPMIEATQKAIQGFSEFVREDISRAQAYLGSLYASLDDKGKNSLALLIGQAVTDIKNPSN